MNSSIKVVFFNDDTNEESQRLHVMERDDTTVEVYALPSVKQIDTLVDLLLHARILMAIEEKAHEQRETE